MASVFTLVLVLRQSSENRSNAGLSLKADVFKIANGSISFRGGELGICSTASRVSRRMWQTFSIFSSVKARLDCRKCHCLPLSSL